jgi:DNA-directed RNA polymerase subunit K/omega
MSKNTKNTKKVSINKKINSNDEIKKISINEKKENSDDEDLDDIIEDEKIKDEEELNTDDEEENEEDDDDDDEDISEDLNEYNGSDIDEYIDDDYDDDEILKKKLSDDEDEEEDEENEKYNKNENDLYEPEFIDYSLIDEEEKIEIDAKITRPFLTKYEKVKLLAYRTNQLSKGAKTMIKTKKLMSSKEIAIIELNEKVIPLLLLRPIPNGKSELWNIRELEF